MTNLGQFDSALDYYEQALQIDKKIGDRAGEGVTLNNIGSVYSSRGQYESALGFYQQALEISKEIDDRSGKGRTLNNIGHLHLSEGKYEMALKKFEEALEIWKEIGNPAGEGVTLNNIGLIYNNLAEYEKALDHYQQALEIRQEIGDRAGKATTLNNIGTLYHDLGQLDSALDFYEEALEMAKEIGQRALEDTILNNIGSFYYELNDTENALPFYKQALKISQEIGDRASEGITLNNIGTLYFESEEYKMALNYYQEALEIAQEIGDSATEAGILKNIGEVNKDRGEYEKALDELQHALEISQEVGDKITQSKTRHQLGATYAALGEVETAVEHYQKAITLTEEIRYEIKVDEFKTGFTSGYVQIYADFIDLLVELGRDEEAFDYAQRAKARTFLDQLGNGRLELRAEGDLLEKERQLRGEIAARSAQLMELNSSGQQASDTRKTTSGVENELTELENEYKELLIEIKVQSPETASLVSVDVLKLDKIQRLLDADTSLVEYFITDKQILMFVITADSFEMAVSQVTRADLVDQIGYLRKAVKTEQDAISPLEELYEWLIAPVADSLEEQLIIAPHSVLHYLPFGGLHNGQDHLIDQYSLTSLPSASVLRFIEKREPQNGELLALGNPQYATDLPELPSAEEEASAIAQLYGTTALIGSAASEEVVWQKGEQAEVLHLATHGEYNMFNPTFSTLHLAKSDEYDGRLEVHEIYGLALQNLNLVVLSACESLLPENIDPSTTSIITAGDEVIAFNRAFLYAGTPSVIATLWRVDDEATSLLMERFYTHLRAGESKASALRHAQQEVRAHEQYAHPYYWAGFVLTGDGGEDSATIWGWIGLLIGGLGLVAGGIWWRLRKPSI